MPCCQCKPVIALETDVNNTVSIEGQEGSPRRRYPRRATRRVGQSTTLRARQPDQAGRIARERENPEVDNTRLRQGQTLIGPEVARTIQLLKLRDTASIGSAGRITRDGAAGLNLGFFHPFGSPGLDRPRLALNSPTSRAQAEATDAEQREACAYEDQLQSRSHPWVCLRAQVDDPWEHCSAREVLEDVRQVQKAHCKLGSRCCFWS